MGYLSTTRVRDSRLQGKYEASSSAAMTDDLRFFCQVSIICALDKDEFPSYACKGQTDRDDKFSKGEEVLVYRYAE
jgi:hypothetical protein